jgi:hypothetical protein
MLESPGASLGGSRKNCKMKSAASHNGIDHQPISQPATDAATIAAARKSQPSRAMIGYG